MGFLTLKCYLRDLCVTLSNPLALRFYGDSQLINHSSATALTASYGTTRNLLWHLTAAVHSLGEYHLYHVRWRVLNEHNKSVAPINKWSCYICICNDCRSIALKDIGVKMGLKNQQDGASLCVRLSPVISVWCCCLLSLSMPPACFYVTCLRNNFFLVFLMKSHQGWYISFLR